MSIEKQHNKSMVNIFMLLLAVILMVANIFFTTYIAILSPPFIILAYLLLISFDFLQLSFRKRVVISYIFILANDIFFRAYNNFDFEGHRMFNFISSIGDIFGFVYLLSTSSPEKDEKKRSLKNGVSNATIVFDGLIITLVIDFIFIFQ